MSRYHHHNHALQVSHTHEDNRSDSKSIGDDDDEDSELNNSMRHSLKDIAAAGAMMMRRMEQAVDVGARLNTAYNLNITSSSSGNSSEVASASVFCGHDLQLDAFPDISRYKAHSSTARVSHLQLCCNYLRSLQGVTLFHNLWSLDLSANRLVSLRGLECFSVLGQLWLGRNFLDYEALAPLTARLGLPGGLEILDLRLDGNMALTQFEGYRSFILYLLPRVWMLDGRFVTAAERKSAPDDIQRYRRKPAFLGKSDPNNSNNHGHNSSSSSSSSFFTHSKPFSKSSYSNDNNMRGHNENPQSSQSSHSTGLTAPQTVGSLRSVWADRFLNGMPVDFIMQKELDYARMRIFARNLENDAEVLGMHGLIATVGLPAGFAQILVHELSMEMQSLWSVLMAAFFVLPRERWWIQDLAQHVYEQMELERSNYSSISTTSSSLSPVSSLSDTKSGSTQMNTGLNQNIKYSDPLNSESNHAWIKRDLFKAPMPLFSALLQLLVARLTVESDSASSNLLPHGLLIELQNLMHYLALYPVTEPPHVYERRHPAEDLHHSLPSMPLLLIELLQMATLLPTPPINAVSRLLQQAEKILVQKEQHHIISPDTVTPVISNDVQSLKNSGSSHRSTAAQITITGPTCSATTISSNGSHQTRASTAPQTSSKRPSSATKASKSQSIRQNTYNASKSSAKITPKSSYTTQPQSSHTIQPHSRAQQQSKSNMARQQNDMQKPNSFSFAKPTSDGISFTGTDLRVPVHYTRSTVENQTNGNSAQQNSDKDNTSKIALQDKSSYSPAPSISPASPSRQTWDGNQDRVNERQHFDAASVSEILEWRYLVCKEAQQFLLRWNSLEENLEP